MVQKGVPLICANCGVEILSTDQFCANCGLSLTGTTGQQTIFSVNPQMTIPPAMPAASAASSTGAIAAKTHTSSSLAGGDLLYARYRIVQLVGQGGFGAVYKAYDEHFTVQRALAVKEMSDAHLSTVERIQSKKDFRQEAELLVLLQHINLPDIKDFFEENDKAYLVMEFIEGETLEKKQDASADPLAEAVVMDWAVQLCSVLSYLHTQSQPIIFRDLKPSNVMLTQQGRIKLIDFGIARIFKATAAKDTTSMGTQGYAPIEQYGHGQTDVRSDIYALGATLYDLLTKTAPPDALMRKNNLRRFEAPRQLNPQLSVAIEEVILKAMAEKPNDRFQSAQEMHEAIMATKVAVGSFSGGGSAAATVVHSGNVPGTMVAQTPQATQLSVPVQAANPPTFVPPTALPGAGPQQPGARKPWRGTRRAVLIGGIAVLAVAAGASVLDRQFFSGGAAAGTVTLKFGYSTEKDAWLQAAIQSFQKSSAATLAGSNKTISIVTDNSGSLDVGDKILAGTNQFVMWSPASDLELNRLNYKWKQTHSGQDIISASSDLAPQSLVSSPLVFAVWQDRANALLRAYPTIDWSTLYKALQLKNGWGDLGHPEWGASIFLGQTLPDQSNSGLLAIMLMAYAYAQTIGRTRLTDTLVSSPALWNYLKVFEDSVNGFGRSSGTYMQRVIGEGAASYAITPIYENLVLSLQQNAALRGKEPLQIFYPSLNAVSNHPIAILQAPWVTTEQQMAAQQFRAFLLSRSQQLQALQFGFRPSDSSIQLTDASVPHNPFTLLQQSHLSPKHTLLQAIEPQAEYPSGDVIEILITQWEKAYPNPQVVS